jgi:hypothetical protein
MEFNMNTLFGVCNLRTVKRVSIIVALALALTACGGGGGKVIPAVPLDQLVESLFAQFDAGTLSEESLITQLRALGF